MLALPDYAKLVTAMQNSEATSRFAPPGGEWEISRPGAALTSLDSSRTESPPSAPPSGRGRQAPPSDWRPRSRLIKGAGPGAGPEHGGRGEAAPPKPTLTVTIPA